MTATAQYCTAAELRTQIGTSYTTETKSDDALAVLIKAASRSIDRYCNRLDGFVAQDASIRYYVGTGTGLQYIHECTSVTALAVKDSPSDDETSYTTWTIGTVGTTTEADAFPATGNPRYPDYYSTPYTYLIIGPNGDYSHFTSGSYSGLPGFKPSALNLRGVPTVKVTATWGYATTVPDDIKEACLITVAQWLKRGESSWADAAANQALGEIRWTREIDPAAKQILANGRYIRPSIGFSQ
jgi:hypothetical protein